VNAGVIKIACFFQPAYETRTHTPRLSWVPSCLQAAGALSMQSLQLYAAKGVVPHPCQTICMAVKSLSFAVWLFGAKLTNHCGLADSPVGGPDKWYFLVLDSSPYYIRQHQFAWCSWHGSAFLYSTRSTSFESAAVLLDNSCFFFAHPFTIHWLVP